MMDPHAAALAEAPYVEEFFDEFLNHPYFRNH
jgi:hypothetical protein